MDGRPGRVSKLVPLTPDGDAVSVKVTDEHAVSADEALERAKAMMVQLTAYGTRGGVRQS